MIKQKGFTLIELLVVISIISLLSSIVLTSLSSARAKGQDSARIQTLQQLRNTLEIFYSDRNCYPQDSDSSNPCSGANIINNYIDQETFTKMVEGVSYKPCENDLHCMNLAVGLISDPTKCWYNDTRGTGFGTVVSGVSGSTSDFDCTP